MPKIYVSRYSNKELNSGKYTCVGISIGLPKFNTGYAISGYVHLLAPTREMLSWNDQERYRQKYIARLEKVGVETIKKALEPFQKEEKDLVLLCFEDVRVPGQWCHRTMFANWWEEKTSQHVPELPDPNPPKCPKDMLDKAAGQQSLF